MLEYVGIEDFVICIYLPHRSHNFAHVQVAPSVYTVASAATLAKELSCQGRRVYFLTFCSIEVRQ